MIVKTSMIAKELRPYSWFFKLFLNSYTEARFRLFHKVTQFFQLGKTDKYMDCSQLWIERDDRSKLRICIYKPKDTNGKMPGVLWMHGGGYGMGMPEQCIDRAKQLMNAHPCVVVSPDYRLTIEAPFPAALDDCYTTLLWMKDHAEMLGINANQLFIGGDSAGGGLTAALSLYARDKKEVNIAFQMPLYPMLDDRMQTVSAMDNNAPVWNAKSNHNSWKLLLGEAFGTDQVSEYAAPARASNYEGLPPTATFVGELEPFRDETATYVENLRKAGVTVEFKIFEGCFHAFDYIPYSKISQEAVAFFTSAYAYAAEHYFAEQPY
jgi:acetyl esterase/lipase